MTEQTGETTSSPRNYDYLYQNGAAAIFGTGTVIPDSARKILQLLLEQIED